MTESTADGARPEVLPEPSMTMSGKILVRVPRSHQGTARDTMAADPATS
ncbi:hypothetical protein ACIBLA_13425 [Streptomyces sp. NPDC050433]